MKVTKRNFLEVAALALVGATVPLPAGARTKTMWFSPHGRFKILFRQGLDPWTDITHVERGFRDNLKEGDTLIVIHDMISGPQLVKVGRVYLNEDGIETFVSEPLTTNRRQE